MYNKIRDSQRFRGFAPVVMEQINWLEREFPDPHDQRLYAQERAIVAVTEAIGEAMEQAGLNRTQLAERLGYTKGHISRMLSGRNLTLRSLGDILWACRVELKDLSVGPLGVTAVPAEEAHEWRLSVEGQVEFEVAAAVASSNVAHGGKESLQAANALVACGDDSAPYTEAHSLATAA